MRAAEVGAWRIDESYAVGDVNTADLQFAGYTINDQVSTLFDYN